MCFAVAIIVLRLFHLQVINADYYKALAANQHEFEKTISPKRGEIYLTSSINQNTELVATNVSRNLVFAMKNEVSDPEMIAEALSPVLGITGPDILEKINSVKGNYVPLKKQLSEQENQAVKDLKLKGIYVEPETIRFYPQNNLASQVLGFLGFKGDQRAGQYGVEGKFEANLAGVKGILGTEKDPSGSWITFASRSITPAQDGDDIYLTIDPAIQFKVEEILKAAVIQHRADSGSVVVVDPKTGKVLAMANYPDFNPNEYNKVPDISVFSNQILSADYEPGSVFKPLTMAAAINEGKVTPQTTYEDTGMVDFVEFKIKNSDGKANGIMNMSQVLEKSLNTGMVFVEQQLGHENFKSYVKKFGFGKTMGFELPGEVAGNIDNLNRKGDVFFATSSFGQGIAVTPIQLVTAYTALANNGRMFKPYVVDKIVHPDGTADQSQSQEIAQVISEKTAATVSAMLVNVVENGHGKRAAVKGYYIAGKTGTAQVPYKDRTGYDPNKNIGSFIGYGPVDDPAFLMLVRVNHPQDVRFAESTAAPAFGQIASFILNYLQIPPSRK